jgi:6-phosphogluconolactonase
MTDQYFVYIGTYTKGASEGIYVYRLSMPSGALEYVSKTTGVENPSFLDIHPSQRYLYAVNENSEGEVSAFSIDASSGELTFLNKQSTHGAAPCHLSLDPSGQCVLVANYTSGNVCAYPIQSDGTLAAASTNIQHQGSSIGPRQQGPHAHSITPDAAGRFAFAADLGTDQVLIYQFDPKGELTPHDPPYAPVEAGQGPRHFDFHPNGKYAYLINEIGNTFTAFTYDAASGTLDEIHSVSTLPEDFTGTSHCADVHIHPSGKFVYGSNRGHDSIAVATIDAATGRLSSVSCQSKGIKNPRNFALDPTGTYLFVANQDTDDIVTFRIDQTTGQLEPTGQVTEVPTPVCIKMMPIS